MLATVNNSNISASCHMLLKIVSFNMRGFYQGCSVIEELTENDQPDVIFLQEHWLTPANLSKFESHFVDYFSFGCSAMSESVDFGMLRGRPYGGVMMLIRNELQRLTETIHCDERYVVIRVANYFLMCIYHVSAQTIDC